MAKPHRLVFTWGFPEFTCEESRLWFIDFGRINFYVVPVQKEADFHCAPQNIVPFEDVKAISLQLAESPPVVQGQVGRYEWRMNG